MQPGCIISPAGPGWANWERMLMSRAAHGQNRWAGARRRDAGFSLVELLVVVAVLAVLVGILLPGLARARRSGMGARCLANVRQLEVAHTMYMNDHGELFVDAGLVHGGGGAEGVVERAWPLVLGEYVGGEGGKAAGGVLRSPTDASAYWSVREATGAGDDRLGMTLGEWVDLAKRDRDAALSAANGGGVARWTSYGLNNFLTRYASPTVVDEATGKRLGPWEKLSKVPRPSATVHFLMMTQGATPASRAFAKADHVHADDWSSFGADNAPGYAATQAEINAHGGKRDWFGKSAYGFLDGHAAAIPFGEVYRSERVNKFVPEYAQ